MEQILEQQKEVKVMFENNIVEAVKEMLEGQSQKQIDRQEFEVKGTYTAEELFNMNIQEIPFLWEGLIPQTGLSCLTGSSDCNKSTLLRQLALEIALKEESSLGFKLTTRYNKVIYISTEDDANSIAASLRKQYSDKLPIQALRNIRFVFNTEGHIALLDRMLTEQQTDLIIIDTWADLFNGDINQTSKVRASFEEYKKLSLKHGCAFVFVHHQGKASEGNAPSKNNLLGSQGIEAKMRTVIELRREMGNRRLMTITKGNYVSDRMKGKSFVLELDENLMLLQRKDETLNLAAGYGFEGMKERFEKEAIVKEMMKLKAEGLSFDKIHVRIQSQFKNAPGLTTLKTWHKEQSDSHSPSK